MPDIAAPPQPDIAPEEMSSSGQDGGAPPMAAAAPPDTGQAQSAPPPAGQPPVQVMAAHPKAHIFSSLLNVLGGGNKTEYSVDPQTGTMQTISVPQTKGTLAKSIIAGALTGLLSGGEAKPQPGREISQGIMRGAGAVQQKTAQQSQQAQQTATDDYNRQQQQKVRQMQTAEANLRLYSMAQQLGTHDRDVIQKQIDDSDNKTLIAEAQDTGKLVATKISGKEAMNVQKYPVSDYVHTPDGVVQRTNAAGEPIWIHPDGSVGTDKIPGSREALDATYSVIKNDMSDDLREHTSENVGANTTVKTPGKLKQSYADAQFYNIGGPQFANAVNLHGKLPIAIGSNLKTQVMGLNFLAAEAENMAKVTGKPLTDADGNPISGRDYVRDFVKDNPSLLTSIGKWQHAPGAEPDTKYQSLMNATDPGSQTARTDMAKFFGGEHQFTVYKDALIDQRDAGKVAADVKARSAAEQTDPKYQQQLKNEKQQLTNEQLAAQKDVLEIAKLKKDQAADLPTGQIVNGVDVTALKSLPISEQRLAQTLMDGRMELTPQSMRTAFGASWAQKLATIFPGDATHEGIDTTKFKSYEKARIDYTSGKSFARAQATDNALGHLQQYLEASDDIRVTAPGSHQLALAGTYGKVAQDKAKARDEAIEFISTEAAKATKGGVPDKPEVERLHGILDADFPSSSQSAAKKLAEILKTPIDSLQSGWESAVPSGMVSPLTHLMSPKAIQAYTALTGEKPNFGPGRPIEPTAQTGGGGQLIQNQGAAPPPALLKDGTNTTFKNGQVWTLRNGQPVQVQ